MNLRFYNTLRVILTGYYGLVFPGKVEGLENIPDEGGFVMCANHISMRDPLFLAVRMRKRHYTYLGKEEVFRSRIGNLICGEKGLGGIPIKRGEADLGAVRQAIATVRSGKALGIFPQGTRSRDNTPTPMLSGVAMIAVMAKAPIIPVYIDGPYRVFRKNNISIGKPIDLTEFGNRRDKGTMEEITHRIESAIWGMRPQK